MTVDAVEVAVFSGTAATGLAVSIAWQWIADRGRARDEQRRAVEKRDAGQQRALAELADRDRDFARTLRTFTGLRGRLLGLADAAGACASATRFADEAGLVRKPGGGRLSRDWRPPSELRGGAPRPGPQAAWQALDRAISALTATVDAPDGTLLGNASAFDAVSAAARELASAIENAAPAERAPCSFCAKPAREVQRVVAGPGVCICNECIELASEILDGDP